MGEMRTTLPAILLAVALLPKSGEPMTVATIPPIDAAAPAKVETATFAVG